MCINTFWANCIFNLNTCNYGHKKKKFFFKEQKSRSEQNQLQCLLIVQSIIDGERDSERLWDLCAENIDHKKKEGVIAALKGNYRQEYLFGIKQALEIWQQHQEKQKQCDAEIEKILRKLTADIEVPLDLGKEKPIKKRNKY